MTKLLVTFVAVLGPLTQTLFAGDNPMPTKPVELLLSKNLAMQEQGRRQILEQRAELISQLTAFISDPDNHVAQRRYSVEQAMSMLGELRATQGIKALAAHIGFPHVPHPETGEEIVVIITGGMFAKRIDELLPAVPALIKIGEPCVDEVIKKLWTIDGGLEVDGCIEVLKQLSQHPSVRAKLQSAMQRSAPRKGASLQGVLKMLGEDEEEVPGTSSALEPSVGGCPR